MMASSTSSNTSVYLVYLHKILPPWMNPAIQQDIGTHGHIVSISVRPHLLIDDEYGKFIKEHHIAAMVQVTDLDAIKHAKLDDKFLNEVNAYMKTGTFDEYDYDDEGNRIEESKRIRRFTNWVIIHDGFPMYMKGVSPEAKEQV
jgi:hypothetical protein